MLRRLTGFFLRLGAAHVFDTSDSRDFSLLETAAEFVARYREGHPAGGPHAGASPPPHCSASISLLLYAQHQNRRISRHQQRTRRQTAINPVLRGGSDLALSGVGWAGCPGGGVGGRCGGGAAAPSTALPMLASACPGWVCYAEKTHGKVVLPNISTAKSPQVDAIKARAC